MTILRSNKIKTMFLALIPLIILSGCALARYDTAVSTALILPPVIPYSRDFQNNLANEAENMACPAHIEFGKDYVLTRDRIRIAEKGLKK